MTESEIIEGQYYMLHDELEDLRRYGYVLEYEAFVSQPLFRAFKFCVKCPVREVAVVSDDLSDSIEELIDACNESQPEDRLSYEQESALRNIARYGKYTYY